MQRSRAQENHKKNIQENNASCSLAFPWSKKTIDEQHVFTAFTISNCVGKRLEIAAFGSSGKLQKNVQENKLYSRGFKGAGEQSTNIMFSWNSPENGKSSVCAFGKTVKKNPPGEALCIFLGGGVPLGL